MLNDIECGLHSGFPPCCVAFWTFGYNKLRFINEILPISSIGSVTFKQWLSHNIKVKYLYFGKNKGNKYVFGYIPCPICLIRINKKTVKRCRCYELRKWKYKNEKLKKNL